HSEPQHPFSPLPDSGQRPVRGRPRRRLDGQGSQSVGGLAGGTAASRQGERVRHWNGRYTVGSVLKRCKPKPRCRYLPVPFTLHPGNPMPRLLFSLVVLAVPAMSLSAADWPQWMGEHRDAVWSENGVCKDFKKGQPKELWRVAIGGGYAGPAVANGRVYVADKMLKPGVVDPKDPFAKAHIACSERVLCLDSRTGKSIWKHEY